MADFDDIKQKVEGEWDKAKGDVKQESDDVGTKIEGTVDKLKGEWKSNTADLDDDDDND